MPRYMLSEHAYVRETGGHAVFLDLKHNKFTAVDAESVPSLRAFVRGWPQGAEGDASRSIDPRSGEAVSILNLLLQKGVLTEDARFGKDAKSEGALFSSRKDLTIYAPYTSILKQIDPGAEMAVSMRVSDIKAVSASEQKIADLMEQIRDGRKIEFAINTAVNSIRVYAEGTQTVSRLLAAVGAIALIVGGVGIMNIMLVSVTERTREIGIRMAVGARASRVLMQFLFEAILLSSLGGLMGAALGVVTCRIITAVYDWPTVTTTSSIAIAVFSSILVGIVFGYSPARRAASLAPVDALRSS